jgi:hypothetical protein
MPGGDAEYEPAAAYLTQVGVAVEALCAWNVYAEDGVVRVTE